jgi:hypothetical protein
VVVRGADGLAVVTLGVMVVVTVGVTVTVGTTVTGDDRVFADRRAGAREPSFPLVWALRFAVGV